ncbi:hypothetical protein JAO73_17265 [Hymenobacter sp. BT523]|uniref:hypothetical protein n=1 Tax=Hymenobacter sp. BT523 TaxID=2795725 RepID=UPI0018EAA964|nr:hypothetical protein [Hymenobacter sp. BT523]MBJ6110777.1 hypothetical protein [Hymenobacter sp. BT523]
MNKKTEDLLRKVIEDTEALRAAEETHPALKKTAVQEVYALGNIIKTLVDSFNDSSLSKDASISLKLEGPFHYNYTLLYTLHSIGGKREYPARQALVISIPQSEDFDGIRLRIAAWQSNISIDGLKSNLSGYFPGEEPKRVNVNTYRMMLSGNKYGWVIENEHTNPMSSEELFDHFTHELITFNMNP